jgi:hypothetical protein
MTATTLATARGEAITALQGAGVAASGAPMAEPPYVYVAGDGGETGRIMAGQVAAVFRFICVGGAWDEEAAAVELDALKQVVLETLRELDGWRIDSLGRDGARDWQGGTYLTADIGAARLVTI